jgi:hypothetical protein
MLNVLVVLLPPLLQAGPRDWLADVAYRYQMYSVLDLVNNNTQLLAPGRLDEAPVGKTLLLCGVPPQGEERPMMHAASHRLARACLPVRHRHDVWFRMAHTQLRHCLWWCRHDQCS